MARNRYEPADIEPKWQGYWLQNKTFRTPNPGDADFDASKPKFYVLDMFPYPSGSGLHVGHPEGYTATDIVGALQAHAGLQRAPPDGLGRVRSAGRAVRHQDRHAPGARPTRTSRTSGAAEELGFWLRLGSARSRPRSPSYYKWTQWIFKKLYEKGLAYLSEAPVWWCERWARCCRTRRS
jgi:leucyl-tRNA synthetase